MRFAKKVAAVGLVTGAMMTFGAGTAFADGEGDIITNTNTSVSQSCVANQGLGLGLAVGLLGQASANPTAACGNSNG
ncbi:hypothetical protein HDA32_005682 [Spinactinospora alkalitolerans]|uniref:Chaplin domain-containing protein n=1 Tax=Spinactinospora alkalitolerans TaxID=687207 RepID=A0A852U4X5_9ACTN|nr:hypothetical protein [Spinactinospora alkalitolerans]NYE50562.1 hypothetical protein [Spinactinospora alkalitolerans]